MYNIFCIIKNFKTEKNKSFIHKTLQEKFLFSKYK